ncbi:tripartite ATP-independent periplasmic transporter DctQ component [Thermincola ferriacetica]|uniref:Tripartite ATP-independent periplasmic transporter DctQ component n=1 Tax=Thermincola ferriacetica TaxID=281456 RepID=A0A0L6VYC6_9FIRM|nr:TRAP transporter small permease [Thermincola ferriacetica]KNZ68332.1 tripartite ATP-independent periplasmic transporter DctQ component [Thermincola ferriacetica]
MANPDERLIPLESKTKLTKRGLLGYLDLINVYINKSLAWIAGISLLLMVFVVVANAVSREVYKPFIGTTELVGWLAAIALAFGLGFTQLQQGYVEIDALVEHFSPLLQRIIKSIMLFLSACFFFMVSWKMVSYAINVAENGNVSETMKIPFYPLIYLVALGFTGLTLALFVDFVKEVVGRAGDE